ncbi:MAG: UDP-N-acetylmuramoyl-L-alanyl-D-glutamate--2,6-diaminopimelate ligase [Peptococcaceae bacterium]|nr:UDP-N-acetylmuramoyl-L-alanyl-D-glutamate--2,6-diaminopimelate ligase [Peptococcaceae bacterium]
MQLGELIKNIEVLKLDGSDQVEIKGVSHDSRTIGQGYLFVAVKGFKTDGHLYVGDAVQAGSRAVLVEKEVEVPPGVTRVLVKNTRASLARLAADFYGRPSERTRVVGVTGTNGKTTTTYLIASIYRSAGMKVGLVGTIANYVGDRKLEVNHTTPEAHELQKLLRDMADEGVEAAVIEVSSHALALDRVNGCEFDVGVFTNLTQDHLDFHRDMEDYLQAKAKLFKSLGGGVKKWPKFAVVNLDDAYAGRIISQAGVPVITYGLSGDADVRAVDIRVSGRGSSFTVVSGQGSVGLNIKLAGLFNVYNTLAAFAVGLGSGFGQELVAKSLEAVDGVPGRFELVDRGQDFMVVVDYAHTPDGLENILKAAREVASGRIIAVFGCGGDRDRTKRPIMGRIAGLYSDLPIITSDNPRTENPLRIIDDVEEGIKGVLDPGRYRVIPDRREAIRTAIMEARKGDLVIIAGKGHEGYQIVGGRKLHFDDREEAGKVLDSILNKKSPGE